MPDAMRALLQYMEGFRCPENLMLQLFMPCRPCFCLDFNMFPSVETRYRSYKASLQVKMSRIPEPLVESMKSVIKGLRKQKILMNYGPLGFQILKAAHVVNI